MRIARLEMDGFKSFGRPTVFDFTSGITGVVGPNGCGKSNVVDAVRWVLGEASRKALRTKSGTDVIFSGSATRKPARQATVSITFDNSAGFIEGAPRRVKITRRLSKNGDSEYFINDEPAKLRDMRALLRGTGAGMSAYSIMEQGKMDALLMSNPDERRKVFEEAAGIGRLRTQQQEAQGKLEIVEQNLARLTDIMDEVRGRLKRIKSQASRALRYTELKERERLLAQDLALAEFGRFDHDRESLLESIAQAGAREGAIQAELAKTRMDLEDAENKLANAEAETRRIAEMAHRLELDISREEAGREKSLSRIESLKQAIQRTRDHADRVRSQMGALKQRQAGFSARRETLRAELAELTKELASLTERRNGLKSRADEAETELRTIRGKLLDSIQEANRGLNRRMELDAELRSSRRRLETLTARDEEAEREFSDASARLEAAQTEHDEAARALESLRTELTQVDGQAAPKAKTADDLRRRLHSMEVKRSAKFERRAMLESLSQAHDGLDDVARGLLEDDARRASFGVLGVLSDHVRVDLAFAAGLERVLGDLGQAIVVDTREHAHDLFDWLAGRGSSNIAILARDEFKAPTRRAALPSGHGVIGPLTDELRVEEGWGDLVEALTQDVLLAADRSVARRLMERGLKGLRLVTPTGEMFATPGAFSLAFGEGRQGVITRQSETDKLAREIETLEGEIAECAAHLAETESARDTLSKKAAELRNAVYDGSMEAASRKASLESLKRESGRLAQERETLTRECAALAKRIDEDMTAFGELSEIIARAEEEKTRCEQALARLAEEASSRREELHEAAQTLADARVREASLSTDLRQVEDSLKGIGEALARYADEVARGAAEAEGHAKEIRDLEHKIQAGIEVQAELERELREVRARAESQAVAAEFKAVVAQAREKVSRLQERLYAERESVQQARIDENTLFMRMDAVRRRLAELYNADIDTLYRDYDPAQGAIDEKTAKGELEAVQEQLRRLGNVNMEAMDELREAEERNTFYSRQEADLLRAKKTLADAVTRIERECKQIFLSTFEAVRQNFQRLFRRLFGGGSADMLLTNPEIPLESGVEIIARPPGKEALPIAMRSGGERAMISVAMMFAIYETNPAPFAILDEVDAPLDEANVGRYCTVVAEYARLSQLILITHHKTTMSACDMLYGVTMQEPGVSKKVSVDLREGEPVHEEAAEPALA